jgi:hypothetical protein
MGGHCSVAEMVAQTYSLHSSLHDGAFGYDPYDLYFPLLELVFMRLLTTPGSNITGCAVPLSGRPWHTGRTSDTDSAPAACLLEV